MLPLVLTAACAACVNKRRRFRFPLGTGYCGLRPRFGLFRGMTRSRRRTLWARESSMLAVLPRQQLGAPNRLPSPGFLPLAARHPGGVAARRQSRDPIPASAVPPDPTAAESSSAACDNSDRSEEHTSEL